MDTNKLKMLADAVAVVNKEPEVYIASAFFDESSCEWVSAKEEEFKGTRTPYFSPREDGLNFENMPTPELRAERITAIFRNNVRNLKICSHLCINLTPCNGKLDPGTLWELGAWIGYHGCPDFEYDDYNTLACRPEMKQMILKICENLATVKVAQNSNTKNTLIYRDKDRDTILDSIELQNLTLNPYELSSTFSENQDFVGNKFVFLTDDWPMQVFILMGYFYAKKIPYYTASFRGYGSNVMIAASSKGHFTINGLTDDRYRRNID